MGRNSSSPFGPTAAIGMFIGGAILAGSMVIKSGLTETATQLGAIQTSLAETKVALDAVAKAGGGGKAAPARRGRPDPNKKYTVKIAGAPVKGPANARITLVEFSDFQ